MATPIRCKCCNGPIKYSNLDGSMNWLDDAQASKIGRENDDPNGRSYRAYQLADGVFYDCFNGDVWFNRGERL